MTRMNDVIGLRRLTIAEPPVGSGAADVLALLLFLARWGHADRERFAEKIAHVFAQLSAVSAS